MHTGDCSVWEAGQAGPPRRKLLRGKSRAGEFEVSRVMDEETLNSYKEMHQQKRKLEIWTLESLSQGQGYFRCSVSGLFPFTSL